MNIREAVKAFMAKTNSDLDTLLGDVELTKAADAMGESREITDAWQAGQKHTAISGADVGTGIPLAAMGSNTQRMVASYASPAQQTGPEADAMQLLGNLGMMTAAMKASIDAQAKAIDVLIAQQKGTNAFIAGLIKAEEDDDAAEKAKAAAAKAEPEDEMAEKAKAEAVALLTKAASFLSRAKALRKAAEDMDDDDDKDAIKASKARARVLTKAATVALSKARRAAYIAGDVALKKSVIDAAHKGDVDFMGDEELDKAEGCSDDDVEKALAAVTTKKADDKGNQADRQDASNGDQAAAAAKGELDPAAKAQLDAALAGIATLTTTVHGIMDMVRGQSKETPAMAKAAALPPAASIFERITTALDAGSLTAAQSVEAESLANGLDAVEKGTLPKSAWMDRLAGTSAAVRALYADAA